MNSNHRPSSNGVVAAAVGDQPSPTPHNSAPEPGQHSPVSTSGTSASTTREQPTAPDPAATATPVPEGQAGRFVAANSPRAVYFLTNWMNLNGVLSSRIVAPRESHAKYYTDLLERVPGWVPLLTQPPPGALLEAVTSERGAGIPVLIEFPGDVVDAEPQRLPVAYLPAIALSRTVAVHFRDEHELRRHRARAYENVHPHEELLKVTPELFAQIGHGAPPMRTPPNPNPLDWRRIDRIRGAINALLVSADSPEQIAAAAAFLGAPLLPGQATPPGWMTWDEIDDHAPGKRRHTPDSWSADHLGFRAAYEELGNQDTTRAWTPAAVLGAIASRIRAEDLTPEPAEVMQANLRRVRSILTVEAGFEPFRPTPRALISAKALLLLLLRPTLSGLLTWPREETGADDLTQTVAALLAGRLRGLARESSSLRTTALDDLTAVWAVRQAHGEEGPLGRVRLVPGDPTHLSIDGVDLAVGDRR